MRNEAEQPAIRPEDVASRSFAFARKGGYEPREVQDFLRRVGEELRAAQHHAYDLEHTLTIRTEELERARNVDEAEMTRILGLETVKVLDAAREAAVQIRERAEESAAEIVAAAQQQADEIRAEAAQVLEVRRAEADAEVAGMLRKASESLTEAQDAAAAAKERAEAEGEAHLEAIRERGREMVGEAQAVRERMLRDLSRRRKALKVQIDQLQAARDRLLAAYEVVRRTTDEASGELEGMLDAARDAAQRAVEDRPAPQGDPDADIIAVIEAVRAERRAAAGDRDDLLDFPDPVVEADADVDVADDADDDGSGAVEAGAAGSPETVAGADVAQVETGPDGSGEGGATPADGAVSALQDPPTAVGSDGLDDSDASTPAADPVEAAAPEAPAGAGAPSGFYDFGSEIEVASDPAPTNGSDEAASEEVDLDVDWWEQGTTEPDGEADGAGGSDAQDEAAQDEGTQEAGSAEAAATGQAEDAEPAVASDDDESGEDTAAEASEGASEEEPPRAAAGREVVSIFARLRQEASGEAEPEAGSDADSEGSGAQGSDADAAGQDDGSDAAEPEATGPDDVPEEAVAAEQAAVDETADGQTADGRTADGRTADGRTADGRTADGRTADDEVADDEAAEEDASGEAAEAQTAADEAAANEEADEGPAEDPAGEDTAAQDEDLLARRDAALGEVRTTLARRLKRTVADEQNEVLDVLRRHKGKVDLDLVFPVLEEHVERYADASLPTLAAAAAAGAEFVQKGWPDTVRPAPRTRVGDVAEELGIEVVVPLRDAVSTEMERHGDDLDALDEAIREAYRQWKVDTPDAVAGRAASSVFHRALREQVSEGVELRWIVGDDGCSASTLESDPTAVPPVRPGCACLVVPAAPVAETAPA